MITVCLLMITGCGDKEKERDRRVVLTTGFEENELFFIGDSKCYVPEALTYICNTEKSYGSVYGDGLMDRTLDGINVSDRLTSIALSRLAQVKAMGLMAADRGIALDAKDIAKCEEAADQYMDSLSDGDISAMRIDRDTLLSVYKDYALAYKVYDEITGDIDPEISDDEARIITIQRILITGDNEAEAMQRANAAYALLGEGTSFDSVADDYNDAPQSKYSFGKDTDEFSPEFVEACFELSNDEVSSPIVTDEGVSIVKCLSTLDLEQTDANKIRIVQKRKSEAFDRVYTSYIRDLRTGFNEELWNSLDLSPHILDADQTFFEIYDKVFDIPGTVRSRRSLIRPLDQALTYDTDPLTCGTAQTPIVA
ncbi:MAG: peptidylprolyl isomerase [Lachnospiraceae bacterium]|nr:peptidylprolyl isomerase [Lachnospiraceae bacterium]